MGSKFICFLFFLWILVPVIDILHIYAFLAMQQDVSNFME